MPPMHPQGNRIVRSWPGSGTCETIYQTEDGTCWKYDPNIEPVRTSSTVPQRIGKICGGFIIG